MKIAKKKLQTYNSFVKTTGYNELYPVFSFANFKESEFFTPEMIQKKEELYYFFVNMSKFSTQKWKDIKTKPNIYHFHEIDNDKNINAKLKIDEEITLVQFKIPGEKQSRIVGYFDNENVFNIVTYDYKHLIYKRN